MIGWEGFIRTVFHSIVDKETGEDVGEVSKPIIIGDNCWIGINVDILKGTRLIADEGLWFPEYCVVADNPSKVVKTGVYRDLER